MLQHHRHRSNSARNLKANLMKRTIFGFLFRRLLLRDIIILALAAMLAGCGTTDTNDHVSSVGARPQAEAPQPVLKVLETYVGHPLQSSFRKRLAGSIGRGWRRTGSMPLVSSSIFHPKPILS